MESFRGRYGNNGMPSKASIIKQPRIIYFSEGEWSSLYIPYLDNSFARDDVIYMFEHKYFIGKVSRVDLVKAKPKNSVSNKEWMSAFVHFEYWFENNFTRFLREHLEKYEKYDMQNYIDFVPPTRRKFQSDNFHVLINQSSPRPVETISRSKNINSQTLHNKQSIEPDNHYNEIIEKQQRSIEFLEEEIEALKKLIVQNNT